MTTTAVVSITAAQDRTSSRGYSRSVRSRGRGWRPPPHRLVLPPARGLDQRPSHTGAIWRGSDDPAVSQSDEPSAIALRRDLAELVSVEEGQAVHRANSSGTATACLACRVAKTQPCGPVPTGTARTRPASRKGLKQARTRLAIVISSFVSAGSRSRLSMTACASARDVSGPSASRRQSTTMPVISPGAAACRGRARFGAILLRSMSGLSSTRTASRCWIAW